MLDDYLTTRNDAYRTLAPALQDCLSSSPLAVLAREEEESMRTAPATRRSERTVEQILDVTDELLASTDLDEINTNRIAEDLGANVATVYRYFENVESILALSSLRYEVRLHLMLAILFESLATATDWRAEIGTIVDRVAAHKIANSTRPPISAAMKVKARYRPIADAGAETSGQLLGLILFERRPDIALQRWQEIAKVAAVMLRSGISVACMTAPPDMDHVALLQGALERYFEPFVEGKSDAAALVRPAAA